MPPLRVARVVDQLCEIAPRARPASRADRRQADEGRIHDRLVPVTDPRLDRHIMQVLVQPIRRRKRPALAALGLSGDVSQVAPGTEDDRRRWEHAARHIFGVGGSGEEREGEDLAVELHERLILRAGEVAEFRAAADDAAGDVHQRLPRRAAGHEVVEPAIKFVPVLLAYTQLRRGVQALIEPLLPTAVRRQWRRKDHGGALRTAV
mmetsp:Transcript_50751/g.146371  ORF Transcript_50751/g.146371 Transcript_50751/m.146371 type:complete len:206 (-) Transcript_50751:417-1034(-)